jgi:hypothetical protein
MCIGGAGVNVTLYSFVGSVGCLTGTGAYRDIGISLRLLTVGLFRVSTGRLVAGPG